MTRGGKAVSWGCRLALKVEAPCAPTRVAVASRAMGPLREPWTPRLCWEGPSCSGGCRCVCSAGTLLSQVLDQKILVTGLLLEGRSLATVGNRSCVSRPTPFLSWVCSPGYREAFHKQGIGQWMSLDKQGEKEELLPSRWRNFLSKGGSAWDALLSSL